MVNDQLVTSRQVANHFGVTVETVRRWVRDGAIPFIRPSRRIVRFRINEVEESLRQGTRNVESA